MKFRRPVENSDERPRGHRFLLLCAAGVLATCVGMNGTIAARVQAGSAPDVEALLQHLDDLYRSKSSIARIRIDVTTARGMRTMQLKAWTRGEEELGMGRLYATGRRGPGAGRIGTRSPPVP